MCSFLLSSVHACKLDLHRSRQTLGIGSSTEKSSGLYLDSLSLHHELELFQGSKLKQWLSSLHLFPVFQGCLFFVAWSPIVLKSIVSYILYSFDFFTGVYVCVCVWVLLLHFDQKWKSSNSLLMMLIECFFWRPFT